MLPFPGKATGHLAELLASRRGIAWAVILLGTAILLSLFPLFGTLGYEFSLVVALLSSFAAADLSAKLALVARARQFEASVMGLWLRGATHALLLLVLPLVVACLNALRVRQCDWVQGFLFYGALPGISSLLGVTVGVISGVFLGGTGRLAVLASWMFVLGSLVLAILRFTTAPPIFSYDPFGGYFPGALYDENISLGSAFAWSRAYQAMLAATALALAAAWMDPAHIRVGLLPRRIRPLLLAIGFGITAITLHGRSAQLGFAITATDIAQALGGKRETAHFVIYYPKGASFSSQIEAIANEHEFRFAQVQRALGTTPKGKITSFYFASAEEKQRWMGAGGTYIAKPWRREIYLQHEEFPHPTLRHEIAHVFAGEFGDPLFRVSVKWLAWPPARFNVGLIEGAAVAADWPAHGGRLTPHQSARALLDLGRLPPLAKLLAPNFYAYSSAQGYTTAGSFCYFLLTRLGIEKFQAVYRAGGTPAVFEEVYEQPLAKLEEAWHAEIRAAPLEDRDREVARERFRRPSIFHRPCPHAIARRLAQASRLMALGAPEKALAILHKVCKDDPSEPTHKLALGHALERAQRAREAIALYQEVSSAETTVPAPLRARAFLLLADVHAHLGETGPALSAVETASVLPVDEATRRAIEVRRLAFSDAPGAQSLAKYLLTRGERGGEADPLVLLLRAQDVIRAIPGNGIGHYLVGRLLSARGEYREAAEALAQAVQVGLTDPLLARENDRLLVTAAFLAGDLATARGAAARLSAKASPHAVALEATDWLERCRFAEALELLHSP
ncbi:MAG: hypothetical protein HY698_22180 [Deltaproteobacteria bacterium]|nr:hypothetical protein [Deltaproteobacteria bacterium]